MYLWHLARPVKCLKLHYFQPVSDTELSASILSELILSVSILSDTLSTSPSDLIPKLANGFQAGKVFYLVIITPGMSMLYVRV